MSWQSLGIQHKQVSETLAATMRIALADREDLPGILAALAERIPSGSIAGPPFSIIRFVTSVTDGFDAEIGFPVRRAFEAETLQTRTFPPLDVLSLVHTGPLEGLGATYRTLFGSTADQGLISDEFVREVYPDWELADWSRVEVQFVLHDWDTLFAGNMDRVLGREARRRVMQGVDEPGTGSTLDERFRWAKEMVERLDRLAGEGQVYDVLSSCAHIFPQEQIEKLRAVYVDALSETSDPLKAVDAVIAFMDQDPGWGEAPLREGRVILATKAPRDAEAYENAESAAEKRRAYCFCPIVRNRLERDMPAAFCYCGAGWYRQQWEGAMGRTVRIDILKSILRGDSECQFAIRLPDDL